MLDWVWEIWLDVVIFDVMMFGMDGFGVLCWLCVDGIDVLVLFLMVCDLL